MAATKTSSHVTASSFSSSVPSASASVTTSTNAATSSPHCTSAASPAVIVTPYYPYPRLSAFPPAIPASVCFNFLIESGQYVMMTEGGNVCSAPSGGGGGGVGSSSLSYYRQPSSLSQQVPSPQGRTPGGVTAASCFVIPSLRDVMSAAASGCGCGVSFQSADQHRQALLSAEEYSGGGGLLRMGGALGEGLEWTTGALCSSAMGEDIKRFRTVADRVFALELLGFLMADQGVRIAEEDRLYQLRSSNETSGKRSRTRSKNRSRQGEEKDDGDSQSVEGAFSDKVGGHYNGTSEEEKESSSRGGSGAERAAERHSERGGVRDSAETSAGGSTDEEEAERLSSSLMIVEAGRSTLQASGQQQPSIEGEGLFSSEERTLRYSRRKGVWLLCVTHLNLLIRRYVIGAAAGTVMPPLSAIMLRRKKQQRAERYLGSLNQRHASKTPRGQTPGHADECRGGGSSQEKRQKELSRTEEEQGTSGAGVREWTKGSTASAEGRALPGAYRASQTKRSDKRGVLEREMERRIGEMLCLWGTKFNVETPACTEGT